MNQFFKSFLLSIIALYFIFELLLAINIIDLLTTFIPIYTNLIEELLTGMVSFSNFIGNSPIILFHNIPEMFTKLIAFLELLIAQLPFVTQASKQ